ncbi:MAG: hypothetical protein HUJ42_01095 [Malacoplasma sp.]|nr:hypothetical protein [Malacoplasma sp.]
MNCKELYDECGELYQYLRQVRDNFLNLKQFHNVPWQLSQIVELMSASKLDKMPLNFEEIMINYAFNVKPKTNATKAVVSSFKTIFYITKVCNNKEFENKENEIVLEMINLYLRTYQQKPIKTINLIKDDKKYLQLLISGNFSNNPLYFFTIYLFLIERLIRTEKQKNAIRSGFINLYLIKNKLLFAPSICFSYPLLTFYLNYKNVYEKVISDNESIVEFSRFVFDLINQASVVSRAFITDINKIKDKLDQIIKNEAKENAILKKQFEYILKSIIFIFDADKKSNNKENQIIECLNQHNLVSQVSTYENKKIYMFNEYITSINKLLENKNEKTTKIFSLKEKMS